MTGLRDAAQELVKRSTTAQGLSDTVTDPLAISRVAALLAQSSKPKRRDKAPPGKVAA